MKSFCFLPATLLLLLVAACGTKKKEPKERFISALSFIQSQVAQVDTSLYNIRKIVYTDSSRSDTTYIPREDFRKEAQDFLTIPDIAAEEYADRYTESKDYDQTLNRVWLVYLPVKPGKEVIQRQEVIIKPDGSGDKISNIIINSSVSNKDSLVEKRMLWQVDHSFQVTVTRQLKGQPETESTYKLLWGDEE